LSAKLTFSHSIRERSLYCRAGNNIITVAIDYTRSDKAIKIIRSPGADLSAFILKYAAMSRQLDTIPIKVKMRVIMMLTESILLGQLQHELISQFQNPPESIQLYC
jgi:hypothetical protein